MAEISFDFQAFLNTADPTQSYTISNLLGGLVNLTVRATKTTPLGAGQFPDRTTLILKYAPPFVATSGPDAPFPQERQLVEKWALSQFSLPAGALSAFCIEQKEAPPVTVPQVLYHDVNAHVLIIQDLGPLITLEEYLDLPYKDDPSMRATVGRLARRLGNFLAYVHAPETYKKVCLATDPNFSNTFSGPLVYDCAVLPILDHMKAHHIPDADALFRRREEDFKRPNMPEEKCFMIGDLHTGSVLVDTHGGGEQTLSVIDWEFASLDGRGPHSDISQFLAWLTIQLLDREGPPREARREFIKCMCEEYENRFALAMQHAIPDKSERSQLKYRMLRSALLLHGGDIINQAEWHQWKRCTKEELTALGAWYLERAGDNLEDMLEHDNWELLLSEKNTAIVQLFDLKSWNQQRSL